MIRASSLGITSRAEQLGQRVRDKVKLTNQEEQCRKIAAAALYPFGVDLPPTKSFELYLIQGKAKPFGESDSDIQVIYPPEFLFVLDVGFESLVGVSISWMNRGVGDPNFPDFSDHRLRSITERDSSRLIFPIVAGSIMIGVKPDTPDNEVRSALEHSGLKGIHGSGWFWTANCVPFSERAVCVNLEASHGFIKYAEPDTIQRLVDFAPGWFCDRLI